MIPTVLALATTVGTMPLVMWLAHRIGAVARPRSDRWGDRPVPRIGGLAIVAGLIIGVMLLPVPLGIRFALSAGLGVIALLGLMDDLTFISPGKRLAIEAATGAGVVWLLWGDDPGVWFAAGFAALAFPIAVNATNMVDNADGVAAGLSAATGLALAGMGVILAIPWLVTTALLVPAVALGFLAFNLPPARVFMGDVGSLTLGFALAAVSALVAHAALVGPSSMPALVLVIPAAWAVQLGDFGMVLITRLRRGVSPVRGGVDHTSHRLMRAGLSPAGMLAVLVLLALCLAGIGLIAAANGSALVIGMIVTLVGIAVVAFESAIAARVPHA